MALSSSRMWAGPKHLGLMVKNGGLNLRNAPVDVKLLAAMHDAILL